MSSYKVTLINPPYSEIYGPVVEAEGVSMPLGLLYIASYIRQFGVEVTVIDGEAERLNSTSLRNRIKLSNPDLVGIFCTTPTLGVSLKVCDLVKEIDSDIPVVMGGPHPTVLPKEVLENKAVDFAIMAEGEHTFHELIMALQKKGDFKKILGLGYKAGEKLIVNPPRPLIENLDELPYPARDLVDRKNYFMAASRAFTLKLGKGYDDIITSRGCPYKCTYCGTQAIFGQRARWRSVENVMGEIDEILQTSDSKILAFLDDTLTVNEERTINLCDRIRERDPNIKFFCNSRVNVFTDEIAAALKRAGCMLVGFGIESGNQQILNNIKKGTTLQQAEKALAIAKKHGLNTLCAFMVGNPGENRKTAMDTIRFALKLNPTFANFFITTPYPDTELYDDAVKAGILDRSDWSNFIAIPKGEPVVELSDLSKKELVYFNRLAYKKFYLRPSYILKRAMGIRSLQEFKYAFKGLRTLIKLRQ